ALFYSRLARLPLQPAQPIELDRRVFCAVARQYLDVLDGHVELVVPVIDHLQTVMRCAAHIEGFKSFISADAVIHMNDEVAVIEARKFRQETVGLGPLPGWTRHAIAQNVGLGDDSEVAGGETAIQSQK